jgi:hypothetical protein
LLSAGIYWHCPSWIDTPHLLSVNQTEFTIEAQPTSRGHARRTRDMMEVVACICGMPVEAASKNSTTAVQCGYNGCETLWVCAMFVFSSRRSSSDSCEQFHLECFNFDVPPRNWRCPNHIRPTKRQRR